ncbi:MAG: hypothetical protein CMJ78_23355 [Planctomycetaceae bacterium]|nr:hypothetical protein [Planctomycetaceae bacterium]
MLQHDDTTPAQPDDEAPTAAPNGEQFASNPDEPLVMDEVRVDPGVALSVPATLALRKEVLPICRLNGEVVIVCADIEDVATQRQLKQVFDEELNLVVADPESLRRALKRVYGSVSSSRGRSRNTQGVESEDAVAICDQLLQAAALRNASDIHLVPNETVLVAKLRVDGNLDVVSEIPLDMHGAVVSRIKVLAGLDIAEKRAPQDGRFSNRMGPDQTKIDIRVATLPTRFGERVTMRLLGGLAGSISLSKLGMSDADLSVFKRAITRPHGMVLLTGPTGSGKSTTLYAAIGELLRTDSGNVITVEDPIEYEMPEVSQVQVDSADKIGFAKALRSILRHDPDVVMIGEIRDLETAEIAAKASLTGHLVFSTLHTNTAAGVVTRLADMGLQRFLIAATLRLAVAQRLVRQLCTHCRMPRPLAAEEATFLGRTDAAGATIYDARGCVYCAGSGFIGRVALIELFDCDEDVSRLISSGAGEEDLISNARERDRALLMDDAVDKLFAGITTYEEVIKAVVVW